MDKPRRLPPILLKALFVRGFDHSARWPKKVRNVSRLGSQFKTTRAGHAKLFTRRFSRQVSSLRPFANFRVNCESGAALVVSAFRGGVPGVRVQPSPPGRAVKALLRQRNVQNPILPFFGIRSGPNKHEFFDDGSNG